MTQEIVEQLDLMAEFQSQRDVLMLEKKRLIDAVYTDEIKAYVAEIEAEFASQSSAVDANISKLKGQIEAEVLAHGSSVKGVALHCVWSKGKSSYSETPKAGFVPVSMYIKAGTPTAAIRPSK